MVQCLTISHTVDYFVTFWLCGVHNTSEFPENYYNVLLVSLADFFLTFYNILYLTQKEIWSIYAICLLVQLTWEKGRVIKRTVSKGGASLRCDTNKKSDFYHFLESWAHATIVVPIWHRFKVKKLSKTHLDSEAQNLFRILYVTEALILSCVVAWRNVFQAQLCCIPRELYCYSIYLQLVPVHWTQNLNCRRYLHLFAPCNMFDTVTVNFYNCSAAVL